MHCAHWSTFVTMKEILALLQNLAMSKGPARLLKGTSDMKDDNESTQVNTILCDFFAVHFLYTSLIEIIL